MSEVLDSLSEKLALLQRYEARYGPLQPEDAPQNKTPKLLLHPPVLSTVALPATEGA